MGYTTEFIGELKPDKPFSPELVEYLNKFANVRHMHRNNDTIKKLFPNWQDLCFKGELGTDGEYFIGGTGYCGQDEDDSIMPYHYNNPPITQPGLWCQWVVNKDGNIAWDQNEKFYNYVEWLEYIIQNFIAPEGYVLNGTLEYQGEDRDDHGCIIVRNNSVKRGA
jgi:hypothetical protein